VRPPLGPSVRGPRGLRGHLPSVHVEPAGRRGPKGISSSYTYFSDTLWIMVILFGIWVIPFGFLAPETREVQYGRPFTVRLTVLLAEPGEVLGG
jgi:hypothetical protein